MDTSIRTKEVDKGRRFIAVPIEKWMPLYFSLVSSDDVSGDIVRLHGGRESQEEVLPVQELAGQKKITSSNVANPSI